jgi:hypothetical protein
MFVSKGLFSQESSHTFLCTGTPETSNIYNTI